jgi:hypothetical protein
MYRLVCSCHRGCIELSKRSKRSSEPAQTWSMGGKWLVAWSHVQCPLHLGGLGVLDMRLMGIALRVRWLWLQHADIGRSWSAQPVSTDQQTKAFFKASTSFVLGDGDRWIQERDALVILRQSCLRWWHPDGDINAWSPTLSRTAHGY